MKRTTLLFVFLAFFVSGIAQTDTLYTKTKKKIPCKITEISETDIKYKLPDNLDGPVYVISATKVYKYRLASGYEALVTLDELLLENQHQAIMNRRSVIKVHPFSYVNNQITFAYERVLTMGTNLDLELGYINNGIMPTTAFTGFKTSSGTNAPLTGFYFKPGAKFLLGQDFSLKGMKFAHPLKGRFILINGVVSYMKFQDAHFLVNTEQSTVQGINSYTTTMTMNGKKVDVNCLSYGLMINYGRQFILGNYVTLEYYLGLGATAQSISNTNTTPTAYTYSYSSNGGSSSQQPRPYYTNMYTNEQQPQVNNYHGFFRVPNVGIAYTLGFRLGFILPEDKVSKKPKPAGSANQ